MRSNAVSNGTAVTAPPLAAVRADALSVDFPFYEDVAVLLWTTGRVVDATRDVAPEFWQRYLALVVDGLRARDASSLPQPPLTSPKYREAMRSFARR